jgi:glycosyltransferase involved in cell wall biosynthesis
MSKKVIVFCFGFDPNGSEAISKEIASLSGLCGNTYIYSLSQNIREFNLNSRIFKYYYKFYPFLLTIPLFSRFADVSHIYTSVNDFPFVRLVLGEKIILTSVEGIDIERLKANVAILNKKIKKIVVQSESDRILLVKNGVEKKKIELIYPGVNINSVRKKSEYKPPIDKIKLLFASSPLKRNHLSSRGVNFLLNNVIVFNECNAHLTMLWRKVLRQDLENVFAGESCLSIVDKYIKKMDSFYVKFDATILPYQGSVGNKSCPLSLVESLACGLPVLVSEDVGISYIVKKEKCGIVFKLTNDGLRKAITSLKQNYSIYQENTHKVVRKYFRKESFLESYKKLYSEL